MSPQPRGAPSDAIRRNERRNGHPVALPELPTATLPAAEVRDRTDYSLGVDDAERARLLAQCALHRTEAETLLDRVGLHAGDRSLDLGGGPLVVLDLLAQRVGPLATWWGSTGRPATSRSPARSWTPAVSPGSNWSSPTRPHRPGPGSFDLVHERLVLNNVPQPSAVVAEMVRLTRPGGHVAVQDVDWLTWTCLPEHADWDRLRKKAAAVWSGDVHLVRRLPALLRAPGWPTWRWCPTCACSDPASPTTGCWCGSSRCTGSGSWPAARRPRRARRRRRGPGEHTSPTPATVALYATFFQAWGRRPE